MPNFKLVLSYDGSRYKGWQRQGNTDNTIQAVVESALGKILNQEVEVSASGRTDAGVHARMQTVSFRAKTEMSAEKILVQLRHELPSDIGAMSLGEAAPRFHARLNCTGKSYLYRIWNSDVPCIFDRRYVYIIHQKLNVAAMERGAQKLCGTHDFAAFSTGKTKKSTVRTVNSIKINLVGDEVQLLFDGDGFLYNMVRIMTGTLIEIGLGNMEPEQIEKIFVSGDRSMAGPTAPAKGLCLYETRY